MLDWRSHLAKTLFIFHKYLKYIKSALFIENYLHFMKNCIRPLYEKLKPLKSGLVENSNFENNRDPCPANACHVVLPNSFSHPMAVDVIVQLKDYDA